MKRELPVVRCNDIQYMLMYALPLQAIRAESCTTPWYMQNYIQYWGCLSERGLILAFKDAVSYLPPDLYQNDYFHLESIDLRTVSLKQDICSYLKTEIDKGTYVIIFLNENLLPNVFHDGKYFAHEYLVYGYNTENQKFKCIGLDKFRHMGFMEFDYEDINQAFLSYIQTEFRPMLITFRTGDFFFNQKKERYCLIPNFEKEIVLYKLKQFVSGHPIFQTNSSGSIRFYWGIGLWDGFRTYLEENRPSGLDYRHPFFFIDQALLIYQRLIYLLRNERIDGENVIAENYQRLSELLVVMKNRYLKLCGIPEDRIEFRELCDGIKKIISEIKGLEDNMIQFAVQNAEKCD